METNLNQKRQKTITSTIEENLIDVPISLDKFHKEETKIISESSPINCNNSNDLTFLYW